MSITNGVHARSLEEQQQPPQVLLTPPQSPESSPGSTSLPLLDPSVVSSFLRHSKVDLNGQFLVPKYLADLFGFPLSKASDQSRVVKVSLLQFLGHISPLVHDANHPQRYSAQFLVSQIQLLVSEDPNMPESVQAEMRIAQLIGKTINYRNKDNESLTYGVLHGVTANPPRADSYDLLMDSDDDYKPTISTQSWEEGWIELYSKHKLKMKGTVAAKSSAKADMKKEVGEDETAREFFVRG